MQVILLCTLVPLPCASAEVAPPIVWRCALSVDIFGGPPNVPISFRVVLGLLRFLKPCMLVRRMIDDKIKDYSHASRMSLGNEVFHIFDCAIWSIDIFIVSHIIAHVYLRRVIHRTYPDDVYAQGLDVVKL